MMYGWLDPKNEFHECGIQGHINALKKHDAGCIVIEGIDNEIEEVRSECQRMADEQGNCHAEWHCLDLIQDNYLQNVYDAAYEAGFLRVGECGSELHFEGRRSVFTEKYQICKDLADEHNRRTVFVPRESR